MSFLHGKELTWLASRRTSTKANRLGADILLLDISNGSPAGLEQTPPCLILPPTLSVNLKTTDWVGTVFSVKHNCSKIRPVELEPNRALGRGGAPRHRAAARTIGTCSRLRGPLKRERIFDITDKQKAGDIFGQPLRTSTQDRSSSW